NARIGPHIRVAVTLRRAPRMENSMRLRLAIVAGFIGLSIGCGSSSPSTPSGNNNNGTPVSIVANSSNLTTTAYSPNPVNISVGGSVTSTNNDSTAHTATGNNGSFDSGTIAPGGKFTRTFSTAGTFDYKCTLHPGMVGTVTVR